MVSPTLPAQQRCGPDEALYVSSTGAALGRLQADLPSFARLITVAALDPERARSAGWRFARRVATVNIDVVASELLATAVPDGLDDLDRLLGLLAADLTHAQEQIDRGVVEAVSAPFAEAAAAISRAGGIVGDTIEYTNRLCSGSS